jgi:glycosyltransferase involved in cell wall biosynthesis
MNFIGDANMMKTGACRSARKSCGQGSSTVRTPTEISIQREGSTGMNQSIATINHLSAGDGRLAGVSIAIDGRSFTGPHTGYAMYLRSILGPILAAGADVTLVTDQALKPGQPLIDRCRQAVIGEGQGPMRWEQVALCEHLTSSNYDFYLASRNYGLPWRYRGSTTLLLAILDLIPWLFPKKYLLKKPRFAFVYLTSLFIALRKTAAVFTISETSKRDIAKLVKRKPIYAILIRLPEAPSVPAPAMTDTPYFVYVGGMDPRKNNALLIEAFARFRSAGGRENLVLIGRGYDPLLPLIDSWGLKDSVRITGYVDDATKTALLAGATALVYPSVYEGYGLPVAEALQVGVRVLTGVGGSLREIGGDAAEYLDPITVEGLAAAMTRLSGAKPDAEFLRAARAQVNRLTSEALDEKIVDAFASLLSQHARRSA